MHLPVSERECKHIRKLKAELEELDVVEEMSGIEVIFKEEPVVNGRIEALLDSII